MTSVTETTPGSNAQRERRRRILDATITLADSGGFDAVQMRAVADNADVALGTLYRYFPSKIHLLVTALGRQFDRAEEQSRNRQVPGDTPHERVMYILGHTTTALQQQPELTEALTRAFMFADASVADEIHFVGMKLTAMITRAIDGTEENREPTDEDTAIVRVISDVWFTALMGWVTGRTPAEDVTKSVDVAVRLLLR
ncbi:AcrR family transcriptional regulator [Aeromicrobium panaciterrae]|uniref:AcrR family transcriptional regulator n=1 Tax=Aeromicrobium panaciterrae TaxID=363861 RepID=A0ABU1UJS6_9ACTN|nr:TetR family transcriptional regulator [Aeromicrobium panaciterrae]MDR7085400.1 AcrR family transcriptional regulator [Aeromicrobium panaciterrae]